MNKNGSIIIIEDDLDDQHLIQMLYKRLNYDNELVFLENGEEAITYLMQMKKAPFIIISDINMPKVNGIELRKRVLSNEAINIMCIPYIILSTNASKKFVDIAFQMNIQGYFQKPTKPSELQQILVDIIEYWKKSFAPGMYISA